MDFTERYPDMKAIETELLKFWTCLFCDPEVTAGNLTFLEAGNNRREEIHWQRFSQVQALIPALVKVTAAFNR